MSKRRKKKLNDHPVQQIFNHPVQQKQKPKLKFRDEFRTQTQLGELFGVSAITIGKILMECGLRDKTTKYATPKAIHERFAEFTPLKDGTPFYMWSERKVGPLIEQKYKRRSEEDIWYDRLKKDYIEIGNHCSDGMIK